MRRTQVAEARPVDGGARDVLTGRPVAIVRAVHVIETQKRLKKGVDMKVKCKPLENQLHKRLPRRLCHRPPQHLRLRARHPMMPRP
mgnify:CR=1 FL=1